MRYPFLKERNLYYGMGPFDGGISLSQRENEPDGRKSPDMLNMIYSNGVLKKREGQKYLFKADGEIPDACLKEIFYGNIIYLAGGRIKAYAVEDGTLTVLKRNVEGDAGSFFTYNGHVYYIGGGNYFKISKGSNGLQISEVEGYIPTVYINCGASGSGDENEEYNYLTGKYKASFSTYPEMTGVIIPGGEIDTEAGITVEYNGNIMPSYRYSLGEGNSVTFTGVSFTEGHNNLIITAQSANTAEDREKITFCKRAAFFGGSSSGLSEGTRVFVSGNPDYANTFFRSELKNPEYFPVSGFEILGDLLDPITGFGKQNGALVIFKKNSVYISRYEYSSGEPLFTVTNISSEYGCDHPDTIALCDNRLVWFNSRFGVMALNSVSAYGNMNVSVISSPVNGDGNGKSLLRAGGYERAAALTRENRYYLCAGEFCYVLDFSKGISVENAGERNIWYIFSNVFFSCSVRDGNTLYHGGKNESFSRFANVLYDFNEDIPIKAYYVTRATDLGHPTVFKTVKSISFVLRADCNSSAEISVSDENGVIGKPSVYKINRFSFINFSFDKFTFRGNAFSTVITKKTPRGRVKYYKIKFSNDLPLSDMAISSLTAEYQLERRVKYNGI